MDMGILLTRLMGANHFFIVTIYYSLGWHKGIKMPTFQFEAMDATGMEIKDTITAESEVEAQATIRQMGYFVTKIGRKREVETCVRKSRSFVPLWWGEHSKKRLLEIAAFVVVFITGLLLGLAIGVAI